MPEPEPSADADGPLPDFELESAVARNSASFQEWVEVFFFRQREFNPERASRRRYRSLADRVFRAFENEHGSLVSSFYCLNLVGSAILTRQPRRILWWRRPGDLKLHVTHNIVETPVEDPETLKLSELLYECQDLAIKVNELVTGKDRRMATQRIFDFVTDVLARLDEKTGHPPFSRAKPSTQPPAGSDRKGELLPVWRRQFRRIQDFFERSARRDAQVRYFWGMLLGLVALAAIGSPAGWALARYVPGIGLQPLLGSFIAGAIGAIVSVMWRMTRGQLRVPFEVGRDHVRRLGMFRPVIGSIFAVFLYFALDSGVLAVEVPDDPSIQLSLFAVVGFLAGFSERFVRGLLERTEQGLGGSDSTGEG